MRINLIKCECFDCNHNNKGDCLNPDIKINDKAKCYAVDLE